jgi:hypothetical protein
MIRLALICLLACSQLSAATIDGTVTYLRGAPPAVLAWLPQDASWKPEKPVIVDQRLEAFSPLIAVAPPNGTIEIRNSDLQQHNVFSIAPEVDLGLGAPGSTLRLTVAWPAGSVVRHGDSRGESRGFFSAACGSGHLDDAVAVVATGRSADDPPGRR